MKVKRINGLMVIRKGARDTYAKIAGVWVLVGALNTNTLIINSEPNFMSWTVVGLSAFLIGLCGSMALSEQARLIILKKAQIEEEAKEWAETNEALETFDEGICLEKSTQPLLKLLSKEELYDLLFSETLMQTEEQQQDIRFELKRRHKLDPNFVGTTDRPEYDINLTV